MLRGQKFHCLQSVHCLVVCDMEQCCFFGGKFPRSVNVFHRRSGDNFLFRLGKLSQLLIGHRNMS